jgi:hypothetical protein
MAYRDRNRMLAYPLPKDITREEFHCLLTALYRVLTAEGINPSTHLSVADLHESDDGTAHPSLYISEIARLLVVDRRLA